MQVTTHIVVERVSRVWEQASYTLTVDLPDDTSPDLIEQEAKAVARHHHDENGYPSSLEWDEEDSKTENTALVSVAALDVESAMRRASMVRLYRLGLSWLPWPSGPLSCGSWNALCAGGE